MNLHAQRLTQFRGDTITHTIPTAWNGSYYDPSAVGVVDEIIFTVKRNATDPDSAAIFQKALGFGITAINYAVTVDVLPSDTRTVDDVSKAFFFDVQVKEADGEFKTVAAGTLVISADITRDLDLTLPVTTTDAPDINHITESMLIDGLALKADKTTTISAGTGLTGGGSLAANRTVALDAASIASLATADASPADATAKADAAESAAIQRANHTGTQTASTISDFDVEVSNNTDVAANTAARHAAVTVLDSAEIDFTLTGQQITAALVAGSIDEAKLDASVNASLDLADAAPADATSKANAAQAYAIQRANHTGEQAISTVTGLQTELDTKTAKADLIQTAAIYVSKVGLDANTGTSIDAPVLTLGEAITKAQALIAAGADGVNIDVMDGGEYTGDIEIPATVHIEAPAVTFIGTVAIDANASFRVDKHFAAGNNAKMVEHSGGNLGAAIYKANIQDGRGVAGTLTGVDNVRNVGGGGKNLFVDVGIMYVTTDGIGIGDVSNGDAGHIHIYIPDLYLAGDNAIGILGSAQGVGSSNIVGFIDHVLEIGSPTGTVGISLTAAGAVVKLTASEIVADTAYSISAGSLYLACPKITGTQTGTPVNRLLGTADNVSDLTNDAGYQTAAQVDGDVSTHAALTTGVHGISAFGETLVDDADAATARTTIGLGNVDNTSDASKPVSTAQQTALNLKANTATTISAGTGLTGGGSLAANRTVALDTASIASLDLADTATQPADLNPYLARDAALDLRTALQEDSLTLRSQAQAEAWIKTKAVEIGNSSVMLISNPSSTTLFSMDVRSVAAGQKIAVWWDDGTSSDYTLTTGSDTTVSKTYAAGADRTIAVVGADHIARLVSSSVDGSSAWDTSILRLPKFLQYLDLRGTIPFDGNLYLLPPTISRILLLGNFAGTYSNALMQVRNWESPMVQVFLRPLSAGVFTSTDVDTLLNDLALTTSWTSPSLIDLQGNCGARTSASDAAVATLQANGVTVTTN